MGFGMIRLLASSITLFILLTKESSAQEGNLYAISLVFSRLFCSVDVKHIYWLPVLFIGIISSISHAPISSILVNK